VVPNPCGGYQKGGQINRFFYILANQGPLIWFFLISPKNLGENVILTHNTVILCKNGIMTLVFKKNANLVAENWQKSLKIVSITMNSGVRQKITKLKKCSLRYIYLSPKLALVVNYSNQLEQYKCRNAKILPTKNVPEG
jgi:hypothetical protein